MPHKKTFSALLLILCVFPSLLTSCSNAPASETTAGETTSADISEFQPETTTAPETTARELHEPNVRQLTNVVNTDRHYSLSAINGVNPYVINSVEGYREWVGSCVFFDADGSFSVYGEYSYGFPITKTGNDERMNKTDLLGMYDDDFFSERVLVVIFKYTSTSPVNTMLVAISPTGENDLMIFDIAFVGRSVSLMITYEAVKFIELDRDFIEGKNVLTVVSDEAVAYKTEWYSLNREVRPETDEESYALLLETYGDEFYYIEPWALKPES